MNLKIQSYLPQRVVLLRILVIIGFNCTRIPGLLILLISKWAKYGLYYQVDDVGKTSDPVCLAFEARPLSLLELPDHQLVVGCIVAYNSTDLGKRKSGAICEVGNQSRKLVKLHLLCPEYQIFQQPTRHSLQGTHPCVTD